MIDRPDIPHRTLGRTALPVTTLGLGGAGAALGDLFERLPEPQADDVVSAALELGINYFDTAPFYGGVRNPAKCTALGHSQPKPKFPGKIRETRAPAAHNPLATRASPETPKRHLLA